MKTIGFIGVGKMATAIISGLDKTNTRVLVSGRDFTKTKVQASTLNITATHSHQELVEQSDFIVLAIKPQVLPAIATEISGYLTENKVIISIAAGFDLTALTNLLKIEKLPIIRVMPNINAQIQKSASAIVRNAYVSDEDYILSQDIFKSVGTVHEVAEKDFSTFTALAGSSPAYIYMFIDALSRAGVLHGIPKEKATKIVAETVAASAHMILQSEENPWSLVDKVSSPGGTTIAGVVSLEQNKFVGTVIEAITATIDKEKTLG
jgi:pyrroline-5-carboxylate reductase